MKLTRGNRNDPGQKQKHSQKNSHSDTVTDSEDEYDDKYNMHQFNRRNNQKNSLMPQYNEKQAQSFLSRGNASNHSQFSQGPSYYQ
jgi:hypothetical protein